MSTWGSATFGDPCRECGFAWSLTAEDAVAVICDAPVSYRDAVHGATGRESAADLVWNVAAYIAHVTDNLRIWGERLAAAAGSEEPITLVPYDNDGLASARGYVGFTGTVQLAMARGDAEQRLESFEVVIRGRGAHLATDVLTALGNWRRQLRRRLRWMRVALVASAVAVAIGGLVVAANADDGSGNSGPPSPSTSTSAP